MTARSDLVDAGYRERADVMSDVGQILEERKKTHGEYSDSARVSQALKRVVHDENSLRVGRGQESLPDFVLETLDMVQHKVARILSGDWDFRDHFDDIGGYAKLSSDRCSK